MELLIDLLGEIESIYLLTVLVYLGNCALTKLVLNGAHLLTEIILTL